MKIQFIKICFVAFFSLTFTKSYLNAQEITVTEAERLSNDITHFDILGKIGEKIMLFKYGRNYFEINAFDSNDMELIWSRDINFKTKRPLMNEMILTKGGAIAFYSVKQSGTHKLYAQPLTTKFKLKGEPILVNESGNRNAIYRVNHNISRNFFVVEVIDKSALNGNENIEVLLLDSSLKQVGNTQVENNNNWRFKNSLIGLNGELFLISERKQTGLFADEDLIRTLKINTLVEGKSSELKYQKPDTLFAEYKAELNHTSSQLILGGTFSNNDSKLPNGYFFTTFNYAINNGDLAVFSETFEKLPNDLRTQTARKSILGNKNRLKELKFQKMIPRTDGGVLLIGELFTRSVISIGTGGNISTDLFAGRSNQTTSFSHDDMIIISLNPAGEVEWTEVLRKEQYSEDDDGHFSSFGVFNTKDKIDLIFNEEVEYSSPVSSFSLSENGASKINTLFNSDKYDILISPRFAKQVAKNELIIPAYTSRNYFVLVQLIY